MTVVLKVRLLAAVVARAFFKLVQFLRVKVQPSPISTVVFAFSWFLELPRTATLVLVLVLCESFAHEVALLATYSLHL